MKNLPWRKDMTDDSVHSEISKLFKEKCKAEKRLLMLKKDASSLVESLRTLANCFDEKIEDVSIEEVRGDSFVWREGSIEFPSEAQTIASEIYELEIEIKDLAERLDLAVGCS